MGNVAENKLHPIVLENRQGVPSPVLPYIFNVTVVSSAQLDIVIASVFCFCFLLAGAVSRYTPHVSDNVCYSFFYAKYYLCSFFSVPRFITDHERDWQPLLGRSVPSVPCDPTSQSVNRWDVISRDPGGHTIVGKKLNIHLYSRIWRFPRRSFCDIYNEKQSKINEENIECFLEKSAPWGSFIAGITVFKICPRHRLVMMWRLICESPRSHMSWEREWRSSPRPGGQRALHGASCRKSTVHKMFSNETLTKTSFFRRWDAANTPLCSFQVIRVFWGCSWRRSCKTFFQRRYLRSTFLLSKRFVWPAISKPTYNIDQVNTQDYSCYPCHWLDIPFFPGPFIRPQL